jgi:hypothetical protein
MSDSSTTRVSMECRNCRTPAPMDFCPACGQETAMHPPTVREFVHEFASHYIAIDGPLLRTLKTLLFYPGKLTAEYLSGRKRAYVLPLRLYLTISLIVWAGLSIQQSWRSKDNLFAHASMRDVSIISFGVKSPQVSIHDGVFSCTGLPDRMCEHLRHRYQVPDDELRAELSRIAVRLPSYMAYAMFGVVGLFALCTQLAFRRSRLRYGEHLVFAFHLHGVGLLALLLTGVLPPLASLALLAFGLWYLVAACKRVFGGGWRYVLPRGALVGLADIALLAVFTMIAGLISALA